MRVKTETKQSIDVLGDKGVAPGLKRKRKGRTMKLMAQLAVIGALMAGATALNAQTNIDANVNISLSGVIQTGATASRGHVSTKDVIQAILPGASAKARLILRTSPGSDGGFIVRDGTVETPTSALTVSSVGTRVRVETTRGSVITDKDVQILRFVLTTDTLSFDV